MLELEKVLKLQDNYINLELYEKDLIKLENDQEILKLERTCLSDKNNLEKVISTYKDNEIDISIKTIKLQDYSLKYEKAEATIYKGEITDLKQLDHLNKEKSFLKDLIDELENEILNLLEKNEIYQEKILHWESEIKSKERTIEELKKEMKESLLKTRKEIDRQKNLIEDSLQNIDYKLLDQFQNIREKKKSTGIARVIDNACSECNIMIRPAQVDRIKLGKEVYTCENCGRLLIFLNPNKDE